MEAKKRIEELSKQINHYNDQYYLHDKSEISDFEFDKLLEELIKLEEENPELKKPDSPTQRVGGGITKKFEVVEHHVPMLSLGNTYSEEEIRDFDTRIKKDIPEGIEYLCELKYDGVAISLVYENGYLSQGITRGDGSKGDLITNNVKTIKSIPLKIKDSNIPGRMEVRGEVYLSREEFARINSEREAKGEDLFANPRNTASGTLKMQDSGVVASRKLECNPYSLILEAKNFSQEESLNSLKNWGFKISPTFKKCKTIEEVLDYIEHWRERRFDLPMDTDGIVIKVNSPSYQKQLGSTAKSPRWAIAFKYPSESKETVLEDVHYQVGRTGAITPVANLAPVEIAGTIVKRASLHNTNEINRLDIHLNDHVLVEKGGEIIPKVTAVVKEKRKSGSKKVSFPDRCPACSTPLIKNPEEAAHYCPNYTGCPPQVLGRIQHFVSKNAMDIDSIGVETLDGLIKSDLIQNYSDLYKIRKEDLLNLELEVSDTGAKRRLLKKSVDNILQGIEESKKQPFEKVLFALGIRFVGQTTAEILADHFGNLENLRDASFEQLIEVPSVGDRIANSIIQFFDKEENILLVESLRSSGLSFELEKKDIPKDGPLIDKKVVVSGVFQNFSREEIKKSVKDNGGKIVGSISGNTDLLIAGENMGPAKKTKAEKLGIEIVDEEAYLKMINRE